MNEAEILGYLVSAIITLGGFVTIIMKFVQPINDLRVVIQKLNDAIDTLKNEENEQNERLNRHGDMITNLDRRVLNIETKLDRSDG